MQPKWRFPVQIWSKDKRKKATQGTSEDKGEDARQVLLREIGTKDERVQI